MLVATTESLASAPGSLSAYFEGSQELLHAIAAVLDIRSVFPCVSEIAKRMVPHARVDTTNLKAFERDTIAQVLEQCRWNKPQAALRLGLTRTQLYVRMRRYGLEPTALAEASAVA